MPEAALTAVVRDETIGVPSWAAPIPRRGRWGAQPFLVATESGSLPNRRPQPW